MIRLTDDQAAALRFLDHDPRAGGVLAPQLLSLAVPEFTDRRVFVGHAYWEPAGRLLQAATFFAPGSSRERSGRSILRASGARFVIGDCTAPASLGADLVPLARPVARFGCVSVYAVA